MDANIENNEEEPFLKIGAIWSEAEENFDQIPIKEEIQSDGEGRPTFSVLEEDVEQENPTYKIPVQSELPKSDFAKSYALLWKEKNFTKTKDQNDESKICNTNKARCSHNLKNFKLVKKRLRCSECRSLVCPECCKVFPFLQSHLSGNDPFTPGFYSCKLCPLAFNSLCALQAHIRIHTLESPHVCPDCGLIYNNIYFLILHLINKCYHVYKVVRYKCKICPDAYFSSNRFMTHIKQKHIIKTIKCSYCSLMFNSQDEFDAHLDTLHLKQKIHRLKYFCCLLCSEMQIPEAMHQKHINQHCDTPEGYDIDYQCCCGEICRLISPFRNHITYCPKKGILPSHWGFLQKNIGPLNGISVQVEDDQDPLAEDDDDNIDFSAVLNLYRSTINSNNSLSDKNKDDNIVSDKPEASNHLLSIGNNEDLIDFSHGNGGLNSSNKKSTVSVSYSPLKNSNSTRTIQEGVDVQEVELLSSQSKESEGQHSEQDCNTRLVEESSSVYNSEKSNSHTKEKGGVQVGIEPSKMGYDHIPCDHLGYLRVQYTESNKNSTAGEMKLSEGTMVSSSSNDFQTITELDEKTGLITTRKIPIETRQEDESDCRDENSEDLNGDTNLPLEMFNGDRIKIKLNSNSYFMCPFCVVLFPKGLSAFQQFRLHIENYHPDAAINITVDQSDKDKPENHCEATKEKKGSDAGSKLKNAGEPAPNNEQQSNFETDCFKVVATKTYRRRTTEGDKKEDNSDTGKDEKKLENSNNDLGIQDVEAEQEAINASNEKNDSGLPDEEEKENVNGETDKSVKKDDQSNGNDLCWSMKLSVKSNESLSHENTTTSLSVEEKSTADDINLGTVDKSDTKEASPDNGDLMEKKENEDEESKPADETDEKDGKKVVVKEKPKILAPIQGRSCIVLLEKKDADQYTSTLISRNRDSTNEQRVPGKSHNSKSSSVQDDKQNKKKNESLIEDVPSDYDEEYDNSKDSNWSAESSTGFLSESKNSDCPEGTTMRTRSSEKSRRESEVWSELYESLKMAEKLNKSKKRKTTSEFENKNLTTDYSSKRVVKKPKRYRHSSDSQDSICDFEFSESEDELVFRDKSSSDINPQGQDETELSLQKKQTILKEIEGFDPQVVDYLFQMFRRKECYPLMKHSSLQTSRYSQDLRSYRQKVLKGIKNRSRSYKVLAYQNMMKKNSLGEDLTDGVEILDDGTCQSTGTKTPSPAGSKSGEKKRGRPRKMKYRKLTERKKSDKEVDFFEKNFETEGSDGSLYKRKRKLSSKLQYYKTVNAPEDKDEFSSGQVITSKSGDSSRLFTCAVCKEIFPDDKIFREHIVIHRMEEGTYQCMECGECFVVRPSLEKHLHAFHKIKNTDKYITENDCWNIKKENPEGSGEPLKENQCKVCLEEFERAVDLTKHFRIHGMAFLKEFKKDSKPK